MLFANKHALYSSCKGKKKKKLLQSQGSVVKIVLWPFNITVKHLKANIVPKEKLLEYRAAVS